MNILHVCVTSKWFN
ncbi:tryptophanase leader peptide, partial [Shigella flexneri]|nr:tryptophanase leader peptide [Shigella flexneri]